MNVLVNHNVNILLIDQFKVINLYKILIHELIFDSVLTTNYNNTIAKH